MLLDRAHEWLGWPDPGQILEPEGAGAKVYGDFAKQKIGDALKRAFPSLQVDTGILVPDSHSANSVAPLAVVCQFPNGARTEQLQETHRLAWNFSRTALLVTLEPHRLVAWTCYQDPQQPEAKRRVCELPTAPDFLPTGTREQRSVRDLLHWVSLITGHFLRQYPDRFPEDGRADFLLLKNLRDIRRRLIEASLDKAYCHDLLARVIFSQFLFHRRDSDGNPFFSRRLLARRCDGALRSVHEDLTSILGDKEETYALFRWLDDRFNGDLFPGRPNQSASEREAAWRAEKDAVTESHLRLLSDFVAGKMDTADRQLCLWPHYSFDTIPLEFISSVYEEFLNEEKYKHKAFYTPPYLVDYLLDAILPWDGEEWNLRILDPACGSGIFLVKAFQRLIYRWRRAHGREPLVRDLKPILANNLVGVDINPEAIRVASFSLYLAMADAIEPKHYVNRERIFPPLRGKRLISKDFFDEMTPGFRTKEDAGTFDAVIGNVPWGDGSITETSEAAIGTKGITEKEKEPTKAQRWASRHKWPVANKDLGPLFLAKSASLVREPGRVAMVQPAPAILYQRARTACDLRRKLFTKFAFDEVTNLSLLRRDMFAGVIGPACVVVFGVQEPKPERLIHFYTPKPVRPSQAGQEFVIEPQDVNKVSHSDAANDPLVWPILSLGGPRDLQLVRRLQACDNLERLKKKGKVITRLGIIPGNRKKRLDDELASVPYFDAAQFPENVFLEFDVSGLSPWGDPRVADSDSTNFEAFKRPQLLIKQSFSASLGRFRAVLVRSNDPVWGTISKKTYLSVRDLTSEAANIRSACLVFNSIIATYFLCLTSSRVGHYIPEALTRELLRVPLPPAPPSFEQLDSFEAIDELTKALFELTQADWVMIEDFLEYTLPDAIRKSLGPGRQSTTHNPSRLDTEPLTAYSRTFIRVLKSTFGKDKPICATIFQEAKGNRLPIRMITIHLDWPGQELLRIECIKADGLLDKLAEFHTHLMKRRIRSTNGDGLGFQRVAFLIHAHQADHGRVQNLTIIKPDEQRYWTRSLAMRDADEFTAVILKAAGRKGLN